MTAQHKPASPEPVKVEPPQITRKSPTPSPPSPPKFVLRSPTSPAEKDDSPETTIQQETNVADEPLESPVKRSDDTAKDPSHAEEKSDLDLDASQDSSALKRRSLSSSPERRKKSRRRRSRSRSSSRSSSSRSRSRSRSRSVSLPRAYAKLYNPLYLPLNFE